MYQPNIITELYNKDLNFTFKVRAYRKLTQSELKQALYYWMQSTRHKKIPKNTTIEVISIHGHDD